MIFLAKSDSIYLLNLKREKLLKKGIYFLILFLSSCYKNHLYVQHDKIDKSYLASSYVNTPDYRQKKPPSGQRIAIGWDFPLSIFKENLSMILTVRFWDNNQDVYNYKIDRKRGYKIYTFQDDSMDKTKKILTYKIDIFNEDGKVIEKWEHQFWKNQIKINKEENIEAIMDDDEDEIF